jgi:hypothetical protein
MNPDGYTSEGASPVDLYGLNNAKGFELRKALRAPYTVEKLPNACKECFKKDALGIDSVRTQYDARASKNDAHELKDWATEDDIVHLDLSLTNICNFKCRYCYSRNSSKWIAEKNLLFDIDKDFFMRNITGDHNKIYDTDPNDFVKFVCGLKNLKTIEFKGGEPFLSKSHLPILRRLIEAGRAKDLSLQYTSNGSIFSKEVSELWRSFHRVDFTVSADGRDPVFQYTRSDSIPFDLIWRNFSRYCAEKSADCHIHATVSVFNFLYLPQFFTWLAAQPLDFTVSVGVVYTPPLWCFRLLPERHIQEVALKLKDSQYPQVRGFANSLLEGVSHTPEYAAKVPDFWYANTGIDRVRKKSLQDVLPELWSALQGDNLRSVSEFSASAP